MIIIEFVVVIAGFDLIVSLIVSLCSIQSSVWTSQLSVTCFFLVSLNTLNQIIEHQFT